MLKSIQSLSRWKVAIAVVVPLLLTICIIVAVVLSNAGKGDGIAKLKCHSFKKPVVVLVSMDGFRADYFDRKIAPNIMKLAKTGVHAEYMRSQFPTKTFPNHYSIVTGLYPESHGIVSNSFQNEQRTDTFRIGGKSSSDLKWWRGEPIWVTATKQGLKSATYFWVGSETKGIRPDYWKPYNKKVSFEERVNQVLYWLEMDASTRPAFISLYFEEPDSQGHRYGPDSPETNTAITNVDKMIGRLVDGIKERGLTDCTNIVLVSDHGMTNISCSRVIYLDTMISLSNVTVVGQGASSLLYLKNNANITNMVNQLKCQHKHLQVYSRHIGNVPIRLHYSSSKRIGDIILVPDIGWSILKRNGSCSSGYKGAHGYDYLHADMQALFVANGPSFKKGLVVSPFSNIEVYNLLTEILALKPAPNNGTFGSLSFMLANPATPPSSQITYGNNFTMDCQFPIRINERAGNCALCTVCSGCNVDVLNNTSMYRNHMNLSQEQVNESLKKHFPWGSPQGGAGKQGCLLVQKHYVIGYSGYLRIPLWVGYKLTAKHTKSDVFKMACFRRDLRLLLNQSSLCSDFGSPGFNKGQLAPTADFQLDKFAAQDTFILSNTVPQSTYFTQNSSLWSKAEGVVRRWAVKYDPVYVISGSIFDADGDGYRDEDMLVKRWTGSTAIPTHFYKVIVRCNNNSKEDVIIPGCHGVVDALAFVFPHNQQPECELQDWRKRLLKHVASINDIEKLTRTILFPNLMYPFTARFKSHLPSELWPIS